jgi:hypothetical protein
MLVMLRWNHIIVVSPTLQRDISEVSRVSSVTDVLSTIDLEPAKRYYHEPGL